MEFIDLIAEQTIKYLPVGCSFVGFFALLATQTPNKVDDRIAQVFVDIVNFLGANLNRAKNDPTVK